MVGRMSNTALQTPVASPIQACLEQLHARFAGLTDGEVARYLLELAKADPAVFGIVIATVDGQVYEVGAARRRFTIQSIAKPLVYGVALEDCGPERVLRSIGVEPSGDAFNSISLEPGTGRPLNPIIIAGAIATAALVGGNSREARLVGVVDALSAMPGGHSTSTQRCSSPSDPPATATARSATCYATPRFSPKTRRPLSISTSGNVRCASIAATWH